MCASADTVSFSVLRPEPLEHPGSHAYTIRAIAHGYPLTYTPVTEIDSIHARLLKTFQSGKTRPLAYRRHQLLQLARLARDNAPALEAALFADLNKPRFESTLHEVTVITNNALGAAEHLEEWAKPEKPEVAAWRSTWDTTAYKCPKGLALIIAPWNYPFVLVMNPFVGAIAAGCTWAHILFTGSITVGRIVAAAAAKFVTPMTLELGGKSPVIIDPDFDDLDLAAKRILHGRLQNSGQLCVSPDYVLVPRQKVDAFVASLRKAHDTFLPDGPFHENAQLSKIINRSHHARLLGLLERTKGEIVLGGQHDGDRRLAPTVVKNVQLDDALMENEIFGPIIPLIAVDDVDHAISIVRQRPIPLALYAFTNSEEVKNKLVEQTESGALALNDTWTQTATSEIPFGGQGDSGYGGYYSKASFDTFTHIRAYTNVPPGDEPHMLGRYHPYTPESLEANLAVVMPKIPDA
ncbi:Aldehyde dehydrogenase family 3 member B1 [Grifola frondosa]|uniref:Aldehyde dehydrogenase n=1 Tax=Grifola frondosa TaxID=5627 RepID=A0A1C7ML68_GRIFR|nr:Aldehyde dehydrogenase family 3 member B1 [Grifola frondosa]